MHSNRSAERGFTLLETLVAATILVVGVAALAQIVALSTRANALARRTTDTTLLAQQKMEQLRALTWGFDLAGRPVSDTTTDGRGLTPSPPATLDANVAGYCDFVDHFGRALGGGTTAPAGAVYVRRWSIEPLPANPEHMLMIRVRVVRVGDPAAAGVSARLRALDEARITTVKTRKAA